MHTPSCALAQQVLDPDEVVLGLLVELGEFLRGRLRVHCVLRVERHVDRLPPFPKQLVCKGFSIFLKAGKWGSEGENGRPRIGRPALCGQAKREGRPRKAKDFHSPCFAKSTPARTGRTPA